MTAVGELFCVVLSQSLLVSISHVLQLVFYCRCSLHTLYMHFLHLSLLVFEISSSMSSLSPFRTCLSVINHVKDAVLNLGGCVHLHVHACTYTWYVLCSGGQ